MTTTPAGNDERRTFRILMWLGHYYPRVSPAFYVTIFISAIVGLWVTPTPPWAFANVNAAIMTTIVAMMFCRDIVHNRNVCLRDVNESPLLNPQAAVDKNMDKLRLYHRDGLTLSMISLIGVLGCGSLLGTTGFTYSWPWIARVAITAGLIVGVVIGFRIDRSRVAHDRLKPWCPWCHRRNDDDDDPVHDPVPEPSGTVNKT